MFWSMRESLWEWDCVAGIWRIPLSPGYQASWVCRASGSAFALIAVTTGGGAFGNWLTWERKRRVGSGYVIGHLLLVHKVRHSFMITTVQRQNSQTYIIHAWSWIATVLFKMIRTLRMARSCISVLVVMLPHDAVYSHPVLEWKKVSSILYKMLCIQRPVCIIPSLIGV